MAAIPTRLIICVDGAGTKPTDSETNIKRIFSGVQQGKILDTVSGIKYNQIPHYISSTSSDGSFSSKTLTPGVLGQSYTKQIQDVYERCCELTGSNDEVWLFGFARGAFVARAVASLLHEVGAATSAGQPEFAKDFKKLVKEAEKRGGRRSSLALSVTSSIASGALRQPPTIRFVGAFDTVKAGLGDSSFDISFNNSTRHFRHAVAMHEDRKTPELLYPEDFYRTNLQGQDRSFIQAWFIGSHADMGGVAKQSGLAFYPLQWMLVEARKCGLAVEYASGSTLAMLLPRSDKRANRPWSCKAENGIITSMYDFRPLHAVDNYSVRLGSLGARISSNLPTSKSREPFLASGALNGYCDLMAQGTVLHPSVYLLLDEHINVALETKELKLQRYLADYRERMLGSKDGITNTGFWLDEDKDDSLDPGAIRVLVCGNTGVGKSTLINKVFGVDVVCSLSLKISASG
jgi:uncharacterized protein (DUF2235 family)